MRDTTTFVAMQASSETRRAYARDLRVWAAWSAGRLVISPPSESDVIAFRDYLTDAFAPSGAFRVWSTVKSYFRWATPLDQRTAFEYVKGPRRIKNQTPEVPSDDEVNALLAATWDSPQRRLIIALLLNGLRASEVADLTKPQVTTEQGSVVLKVIGKGRKERLVPMTYEAQSAFAAYCMTADAGQRTSAYVVSEPVTGEHLTVRQVEHAVYKSAEYAGVEGMHPHALRHHYATRLIRAGATPLHVQQLLGHASVATTQVYVTLDLADLIAAAGLDPRNQSEPKELRAVV